MSATYILNATPSSPQDALFLLVDMLRRTTTSSPNWVIRTSSTGTGGVYAQSGDVIAETADLGDRAWLVLRGHAYRDLGVEYRRELCIQVDAAGARRVKYSPRAGFTGGSPSTTQVPFAADEQLRVGGGTDAAPTFADPLPGLGYRMQGWADEGSDVHYTLAYAVGGGPVVALTYLDMPQSVLYSGTELRDRDPSLHYDGAGATCALVADLGGDDTAPRSVFRLGTAEQLWGRAAALASVAGGDTVFPGGAATSFLFAAPSRPEESVRYLRRAALAAGLQAGEVGDAATCDDKGYSCLLRWSGTMAAVPELLSSVDPVTGAVTAGAKLAAGHVLLPWIGEPLQI